MVRRDAVGLQRCDFVAGITSDADLIIGAFAFEQVHAWCLCRPFAVGLEVLGGEAALAPGVGCVVGTLGAIADGGVLGAGLEGGGGLV